MAAVFDALEDRPLMMYQQQTRGLMGLNHFDCPRKAILVDITKEIKQWQEMSNQILLLMDFKDDVTAPWVKMGSQPGNGGSHHISPSRECPQTYQRGVHPIDGIFTAPQLLEKATRGYLSFGDAIPSDH